MGSRLELQTKLEALLGSRNVYFQEPSDVQMQYPCIVYKQDQASTRFASNQPYSHDKRYMLTVIDRNPDSLIPDKLAWLPKCLFDRRYTADNLNHFIYNIYF